MAKKSDKKSDTGQVETPAGENSDSTDISTTNDITEGGGGEVEKITADANGNQYLPGAEPLVVKELNDAAIDYDRKKRERMLMQAQESEAKSYLASVAQRNRHHFYKDDETGNLIYQAGGVTVTITHKEEEVISAKVEVPTTKASNGGGGGDGKAKAKTAQTSVEI